jgi:glycosyltransferase involved in cell wall biosynthesis
MIVRGEEACLATALASVAGADELVVVDTSLPTDPPDRSMEIAAEFGARIFKFPWIDDFAAARNFSLAQCTGDWVIIIDADEEMDPGGIEKARAAIAQAGAFRTVCAQCFGKRDGAFHSSPRLFKRCPEVYWERAIHNILNVAEDHQLKHPSDVVIRYGYSEAHKRDPDRALRILTRELERNPQAVRETYYLAREHWYRQDYPTAVRWYLDYLTRATWAPEMADAWLMLARCFWRMQQGDDARSACLQAIRINADFREALLFMAEMSGPKNSERWKVFAELAKNEDVQFVRSPLPRDSAYYDHVFAGSKDMSRYERLLKTAASWTWGRVLDVCCGTGELGRYVRDYQGVDFSGEAVADNPRLRQGDVFAEDLAGYDTYVILEALEHLDDRALLRRLPPGADVVFSVPSFADPAHLRTYNEQILRMRLGGLMRIERVVRFNWDGARWTPEHGDTRNYILLVRGRVRPADGGAIPHVC